MQLTLREDKGMELTHDELDSNFRYISMLLSMVPHIGVNDSIKFINARYDAPISTPFSNTVPFSNKEDKLLLHKLPLGIGVVSLNYATSGSNGWVQSCLVHFINDLATVEFINTASTTIVLNENIDYYYGITGGTDITDGTISIDYTISVV